MRRLDDALRYLSGAGAVPLLVARDQRLLTLAFDASSLAGGEVGALKLGCAESAGGEARVLGEAWFAG